MPKLVAVSPVGKNGQTVVPSTIRRLFGIDGGGKLVGFYLEGRRVELAPVSVVRARLRPEPAAAGAAKRPASPAKAPGKGKKTKAG